MRKKILISAYAISPYKGSEFGAAWNTVLHLGEVYDLWVLYGISDNHMGETKTIDKYLESNFINYVSFIKVEPTWLALTINLLNKAGFGWMFYFAYYLWQKEAVKIAEKLIEENNIDLIHQLGPIGFREPGFLWKINKPYVWGPIGGTVQIDNRLLLNKPLNTKIFFLLKNKINCYQLKYSSRIKKAINKANVLIAATTKDQENISKYYELSSYLLSEQGPVSKVNLDTTKFFKIKNCVDIIWSGTLTERKNLQLLLGSLALLKNKNWRLHILGTGSLEFHLKKMAKTFNINEHITWYGFIKREQALQIMNKAHLHVITSIAEGNPSVMFESLSSGVPTLTLDHSGMHDVFCEKCSIKIPINKPEVMQASIVNNLESLLNNTDSLIHFAESTMDCCKNHAWTNRLQTLEHIYRIAIENWSVKNNQ